MVKSLGLVKTVLCQVISRRCYCVPVHWTGKSVVCAGDDCPQCVWRQPRMMYFLGLSVSGARGVYEVPDSFRRCLDEAIRTGYSPSVLGTVLGVGRATPRDEWQLREARHADLIECQVHEAEVMGAVASVYRLGKPLEAEKFAEWFERVRVSQAYNPELEQRPLAIKYDAVQ